MFLKYTIKPSFNSKYTCTMKTSFNGWKCNIAGYCSGGLYFYLNTAYANMVPPTPAIFWHITLQPIE